jgi:hypothetical protein
VIKPNVDAAGSHPFEVKPLSFPSILYANSASHLRLVACSVLCAILAIALLLAPWKCWWGTPDHDVAEILAEAHPDMAAVVEIGDGSWAHTYRQSNAEQKDALEFILRCKIISVQEFAYSRASQDHVDECVWIATQMLRQKPLEDWVAWRQEALQAFEESITAMAAARTAAHCGIEEHLGHAKWTKGDFPEAPATTPPLQGALKDLLVLKGGFASPLVRSRCTTPGGNSNASTVQASPITPGRLPAHLAQHSRGVPFHHDGLDVTFAPTPHQAPRTDGRGLFRPAAYVRS